MRQDGFIRRDDLRRTTSDLTDDRGILSLLVSRRDVEGKTGWMSEWRRNPWTATLQVVQSLITDLASDPWRADNTLADLDILKTTFSLSLPSRLLGTPSHSLSTPASRRIFRNRGSITGHRDSIVFYTPVL